MITSKATRCERYVWAWVTKYPHALASEIVSTDYNREEVQRALGALCQLGYIEQEWAGANGARGYIALVPFVVEVPEWAR